MKHRLAGLVLPDATPVEEAPERSDAAPPSDGAAKRTAKQARGWNAGDRLVVACGIALAVVCALFPWYIFLHQEEFGIRPLKFSGRPAGIDIAGPVHLPDLVGERVPLAIGGLPQIDFIPTGTVAEAPFGDDDIPRQPFPGDRQSFRLVGAGDGRAMIEDDDGFWIVERGSPLPDGSRVARILEREGTWVLVTSEETEITLSR